MMFASGLASMILFQLVVNLGMVIGIMPITGIPLPFISHGGASLISLAVGPRDRPEHQHPADARRVVIAASSRHAGPAPHDAMIDAGALQPLWLLVAIPRRRDRRRARRAALGRPVVGRLRPPGPRDLHRWPVDDDLDLAGAPARDRPAGPGLRGCLPHGGRRPPPRGRRGPAARSARRDRRGGRGRIGPDLHDDALARRGVRRRGHGRGHGPRRGPLHVSPRPGAGPPRDHRGDGEPRQRRHGYCALRPVAGAARRWRIARVDPSRSSR